MATIGKTLQILINNLARRGQQIATSAMASRGYTNRTNNLSDSYVWGVYLNGEPVRYGTAQNKTASTPRAWYGEKLYGNSVGLDFIKSFKPPSAKGVALVVAAVMPYGEVLENGGASNGSFRYQRAYRVIATAKSDLKMLTKSFKGSTTRIIHHGKAQ